MLSRNSITKQQNSIASRRSPRFLPPDTLDPKTPNPNPTRFRALRSGTVTPLSSTPKASLNNNNKLRKDEVSKKEKATNVYLNLVVDLNCGSLPNGNLESSSRADARVTRSTTRGTQNKSAAKGRNEKSNLGKLDEGKAMVEVKVEKRVTRGNKKGKESASASAKCVPDGGLDKGELLLDEGKANTGSKLIEKGKQGVKRKRTNQNEEDGWTMEQDQALQRAYLSAKPTPHFWKKVAKMVPGKTAQECFDKVHSEQLTPRPAQPKSRAKKIASPPVSFSDLLNSPDPKNKKSKYTKRNSHLAHKTVRHLLQKQYNVDQEDQCDLFSVLEGTSLIPSNQETQIFSTPQHNKEKSASKTQLSRFSNSSGSSSKARIISPPVLKQIKNKALHEKYIDQLHRREAKRKAVFAKDAKLGKNKKVEQECPKVDAVKEAKNALFFDARDAIAKFQSLQNKALENSDHSDDDRLFSDNDDDDDDLS